MLQAVSGSPRQEEQDEYKNVGEACRPGGLAAGRRCPGWSGCGRGGAILGRSWSDPRTLSGGSGMPARWTTCDQARARAPPSIICRSLPLLNFSSSHSRTALAFSTFTSTSPFCVQPSATTTRGHHSSHLHTKDIAYNTHFFYADLSRRHPKIISLACSPRELPVPS